MSSSIPEVWVTMGKIFATLFAICFSLAMTLTPVKGKGRRASSGSRAHKQTLSSLWLCDPASNPSKHHAELFILKASACWIASVGIVIYFKMFEWWGRWGYIVYCCGCAAPYVLVPYLYPLQGDILTSTEGKTSTRPLKDTYIFKANVWIAIFSFIGNYWYTHYFYQVLQAKYTFDAHRLNDVPIALYFMTHAYFMFYHVLSNVALRRVRKEYKKDKFRFIFQCALIATMAYTTAFMESLTICGFPYYTFNDRDMAYTLGSAFYGVYFLVSFPAFLTVDENAKSKKTYAAVFWEAMGSSMFVLCLLDFVRLYLGMDFVMKVVN
jgi:cycloeucalenol cycloisomerase|tara:strand:+ start:324 stop:1292 length:969 start_codon:yes stop_codon:yes gene_type:complete